MKTIDDWLRDNPTALINMMRGYISASHLIIIEELRDIQSQPFDADAETKRLYDFQKLLAEHFDLDYERAQVQAMKEKREARHRER
ncbi:MAG: hypothetical protein PHY09_18360 [Desulfuromonadaceae bacterium]|nr:hypothetical protein [Desulfuromonadaceae bacterium]MDD5107603.1 hypothetical protein [Desulfuromonadaceae bacterium]